MTLSINITDGRGLSNQAYHWLLPKMNKVMLYLPFILQYIVFNQLYVTNKIEHFSFKSRRTVPTSINKTQSMMCGIPTRVFCLHKLHVKETIR